MINNDQKVSLLSNRMNNDLFATREIAIQIIQSDVLIGTNFEQTLVALVVNQMVDWRTGLGSCTVNIQLFAIGNIPNTNFSCGSTEKCKQNTAQTENAKFRKITH